MPRKGRSNEEIIHVLHQVEGGEKPTRCRSRQRSRYSWPEALALRSDDDCRMSGGRDGQASAGQCKPSKCNPSVAERDAEGIIRLTLMAAGISRHYVKAGTQRPSNGQSNARRRRLGPCATTGEPASDLEATFERIDALVPQDYIASPCRQTMHWPFCGVSNTEVEI